MLRKKYANLDILTLQIRYPRLHGQSERPQLPFRNHLEQQIFQEENELPVDLLDAISLRELLDLFVKHSQTAVAEFDDVFGERA